jgi:ABC-type phosphate transport system substrate-binding protein
MKRPSVSAASGARPLLRSRKVPLIALLLLAAVAVHDARADVVVIVSTRSTANTMTAEEISQIYLGKSAAMKPIDNGDKSLVRSQFYTKVAGKDEAQVKAIWSKLVFTGKATPPQELPTSADVVKAVAADSNAIGYVDRSAIDLSVKVIYEVK